MAQPIIVTINDVPNAQPVIQVRGAPNGYDIYTGEEVATPGVEDGALVTLFGVDNYFTTTEPLPDWGGRFLDPTPWQALPPWEPLGDGVNYRQLRTAVDIVWVQHDEEVFGDGDLQVGFNSALPGNWYWNPDVVGDENLGPVTDKWVTVYANDTLVVRYKPHTYVAKGYVPFSGSLELLAGPPSAPPEPIPDNPNAFVRQYAGVGIADKLGKLQISMTLTVYPDQTIDPYTDPRGYAGTAIPYAGNAVLTAANRDTLTCLVTGIEGLTTLPWWLEGDFQVTEGTGRFEGARGYVTFTGLEADIITAVFDGTISTIGMNKK